MNSAIRVLIIVSLFSFLTCSRNQDTFRVEAQKVTEEGYTAKVLSTTEMVSNYPMERHPSVKQPIIFKLSLNGRDNEGGFGKDHFLQIPEGVSEFFAPTMEFGRQIPRQKDTPADLEQDVNVHFRVDLSPVLRSFQEQGEYITPTGDTIKADDFQGLFMAGNQAPLNWNWDSLANNDLLRFQDADQDSIYELSLTFGPDPQTEDSRSWSLSKDLSDFPKFESPQAPLLEALTNMALEEALLNIRSDRAFSAGKEWSGVWTRDVAYATHLSLAYLFPEEAKTSLRAKLSGGRIIQDTGTGGAWPISSDRFVWVIAAWEIYLATGDEAWLNEIRRPVIQSLKEDILWNRDPVSGMLLGETSFEDWREQTYPEWMSPADIHASHALSTNIVFKRALEIALALSQNDREILNTWPGLIQRLDANILKHFWDEELNAPSAYIMSTPAWLPAAHRSALGESLGILLSPSFQSIAPQLVESYPRTAYGTPVISHQLPHSPPYHNQAIWPFVEAYALLASKAVGDEASYSNSFHGLTRAAALFLSHRENYHFSNGQPDETEINSDRQLWSVAGWLGAIYRGLLGIDVSYNWDRKGFDLEITPHNPFEWDEFRLSNLVLHDTPIEIELKGSGSVVSSLEVNGQAYAPGQPIPLLGNPLTIRVVLQTGDASRELIHETHVLPAAPAVDWLADTLTWQAEGRVVLDLNGRSIDTLHTSPFILPDSLTGFFTLRSIGAMGLKSLPTQPHYSGASATLVLRSAAPYYIEVGGEAAFIRMGFKLPSDGNYLLRFVYTNGSGPINTGNSCGLAKLKINDWWLEQMISFPHTESWDNWQTTSWAKAYFKAGDNSIILDQETLPVKNMNGEVNLFRVQSVEIIPVTDQPQY